MPGSLQSFSIPICPLGACLLGDCLLGACCCRAHDCGKNAKGSCTLQDLAAIRSYVCHVLSFLPVPDEFSCSSRQSFHSGLLDRLHGHAILWLAALISNVLGIGDAVAPINYKDSACELLPLLDPHVIVLPKLFVAGGRKELVQQLFTFKLCRSVQAGRRMSAVKPRSSHCASTATAEGDDVEFFCSAWLARSVASTARKMAPITA